MTIEQKQETAKAESANEQPNKTRIQDTPEYKDALSKATSTYQKQASDARKESRGLAGEITKLNERITQTQREVELAKLTGDDPEAQTAAERLLDERTAVNSAKAAVEEREQRVGEVERTSTIRVLSEEFGIPQADLEGFDTVSEMRIAGLEYKLASNGTSSGEVEKPEAEVEKESKPIESAESLRSKGPIPNPITHLKEFNEYAKEVVDAARLAK